MAPGGVPILSLNEQEFVVKALLEDQRVDGRRPFDSRELSIKVLRDGTAEVQLGHTRVLAVVTAELSTPFVDRPSEGLFALFAEFSPMASPSFEPGRPNEAAVELSRILERGLKQSGSVDLESLVVLAGRHVWSIRADVTVLDHAGNLGTAASVATLAALLTHRRPEVTINAATGEVEPPSASAREPLTLALHHLPLLLSFAFFESDAQALVVLDPTELEERACQGTMMVMLNSHRDVCAVQKAGGCPVSPAQLLECLREACAQAARLTDTLRREVRRHDAQRLSGRVRRHRAVEQVAGDGQALGDALLGAPTPEDVRMAEQQDQGQPGSLAGDASEGEEAEQGWDLVEGEGGFPFSGPLHPDRLAHGAADGPGYDAEPMQVDAATVEDEGPAPTTLLDAIKAKPKGKRVNAQ